MVTVANWWASHSLLSDSYPGAGPEWHSAGRLWQRDSKAAVTLLWRWVTKHACRHRTKRQACAQNKIKKIKKRKKAAHSKARTYTRAPRTHSISLSGKRLTRIDCLIFAGVCSSVKAPLKRTHTHTLLLTHQYQLYDKAPRRTRQTSGFFLVAALWTSRSLLLTG